MASGLSKTAKRRGSSCPTPGWKVFLRAKAWVYVGVLGLWVAVPQSQVRGDVPPLIISDPLSGPSAGLQITLAWDPSPDTNAVGAYLCWGLVSGQCTNFVDAGTATNAVVAGLATDIVYFFTIVAYDAFGDQAVPSNELNYMASIPIIVVDLTNQTALQDSDLSLQITAAGSAPLSYSWLFNGSEIPGAVSNTLNLINIVASQAGAYQVVITNDAGAVTSAVATVTVLVPPNITSDLVNQTVGVGSNVTLQLGVSGTAPFSYQWLFNGAYVSDASTNPLILSNVSQAQAGTYQVAVNAPGGSVESSIVTLSVLVPPSIAVNPTNQTAARDSNAILQAGVIGSEPLGYQWLFNGTPLAGATSNPLLLNNVALTEGGVYQLVVTNPVGSATSASANLLVLAPPTLLSDLTNQSVAIGSDVSLEVGVGGSGPLSFQWFFNGTNLPGATANPLVLSNVVASQAGMYQVIVSNAVGTVTSSISSLSVLYPPNILLNPASQTVPIGSNVALEVVIEGSPPFGYQWFSNGIPLPGRVSSPSLIDKLTLSGTSSPQLEAYAVVVTNAVGSVTSAPAIVTVLIPPRIIADLTNKSVALGSDASFAVGVDGSAPFEYQWLFNGTNMSGAITNPVVLSNVLPAQVGTYQVIVSNALGIVTSSISTLSILYPPNILVNPASQASPIGSNVSLHVDVQGSPPFGYQWFFNGVVLPGATGNPLLLNNFNASDSGAYQVEVTNAIGFANSAIATVTVLLPPAIITDLTDQTSVAGLSVAFQLEVSGTPPLSYNWLFNGSSLAGVTSNSLNLPIVTPAQAGSYQVLISNAAGKIDSSLVTLHIVEPSVLHIAPENGAKLNLTFGGTPGQNYEIQYSTNLNSPWRRLTNVFSDPQGILRFTASPSDSSGWFRIASP